MTSESPSGPRSQCRRAASSSRAQDGRQAADPFFVGVVERLHDRHLAGAPTRLAASHGRHRRPATACRRRFVRRGIIVVSVTAISSTAFSAALPIGRRRGCRSGDGRFGRRVLAIGRRDLRLLRARIDLEPRAFFFLLAPRFLLGGLPKGLFLRLPAQLGIQGLAELFVFLRIFECAQPCGPFAGRQVV
jgi:hypothetical protein